MIENGFDKGPQGWCTYDYHWSIVSSGKNVFILANWEGEGGVDGGGYVWTDHSRWSADTPEEPVSILPFLLYTSWVDLDRLDLRNARLSVHLRGDDLFTDDARCLFWIHVGGTRWHYASQPLTISEGKWADEPNVVSLVDDESLWHRSWSLDPDNPAPLSEVIASTESFGFSLVGFKQEPRGKLSMDDFRIELA